MCGTYFLVNVSCNGLFWSNPYAFFEYSYLYPDGRDLNPDLSFLCEPAPRGKVKVSEVQNFKNVLDYRLSPATHTQQAFTLCTVTIFSLLCCHMLGVATEVKKNSSSECASDRKVLM